LHTCGGTEHYLMNLNVVVSLITADNLYFLFLSYKRQLKKSDR
jgi:hypothetical protein